MVNRWSVSLLIAAAVVNPTSAFAQAPTVEAVEAPTLAGVPEPPPKVTFGMGLRGRYVTVPSWFLGLFTKENTPLHSYGAGLEFYRRKANFDIVFGLSWQNMSAPDGNWLGTGKDGDIDTDYVQFDGLGLVGFDAAFIWREQFGDYVGIHYGAGLGLGIVTGKILRTSAGTGAGDTACLTDPGNEAACFPRVAGCSGGPCSEQSLAGSTGKTDRPGMPSRFREDDVPAALPILNVLVGMNLRFPEFPGFELRPLEFGFYNAFFIGGGASYGF